MAPSTTAGAASRYAGAGAHGYWEYQEPIGRQGATRDLWKIAPDVGPSDRVVEFGCGGAFLLERLAAGERVGIEVNPLPREAARGRGLDVRSGLEQVPDGWADVVWSNHALEHTLAPYDVLREMHRVLRPGGRLRLCLPVDDWRRQRRAAGPDVNGHLWTWTPLLMHNLLAEVGFTEADIRLAAYSWPRGARYLVRWHSAYLKAAAVAGIWRGARELYVSCHRP
ncbi:MAG: class I SAM-dependent methyltransferase [Actinomycetes bacterium]